MTRFEYAKHRWIILFISLFLILKAFGSAPVYADAYSLAAPEIIPTYCDHDGIKATLSWRDACGNAVLGGCTPTGGVTSVVYTLNVNDGVTLVATKTGTVDVFAWQPASTVSFESMQDYTSHMGKDLIFTMNSTATSYGTLGMIVGTYNGTVASCKVGDFIPGNIVGYNGPTFTFKNIIKLTYDIMLPIGIAMAAFFIIRAGYTIMTSEGNPQKVMEGKDDLSSAVVGAVFILLSAVILRVIISSLIGNI